MVRPFIGEVSYSAVPSIPCRVLQHQSVDYCSCSKFAREGQYIEVTGMVLSSNVRKCDFKSVGPRLYDVERLCTI